MYACPMALSRGTIKANTRQDKHTFAKVCMLCTHRHEASWLPKMTTTPPSTCAVPAAAAAAAAGCEDEINICTTIVYSALANFSQSGLNSQAITVADVKVSDATVAARPASEHVRMPRPNLRVQPMPSPEEAPSVPRNEPLPDVDARPAEGEVGAMPSLDRESILPVVLFAPALLFEGTPVDLLSGGAALIIISKGV